MVLTTKIYYNRGLIELRFVWYYSFERLGIYPVDELNREISLKRAELGADAPLERVLEALVREAAATWSQVLLLERRDPARWVKNDRGERWYTTPIRECIPAAFVEYFEGRDGPGKAFLQRDAQAFISWVQQRIANLTPEMLRRLCAVAGDLRSLMRPVATTGTGADPALCWWLLWLDACDVTAPDIARALQPRRPPHRDRIWKLRKALYSQLSATITAQSQQKHLAEAA
jgi:hypothetical protein